MRVWPWFLMGFWGAFVFAAESPHSMFEAGKHCVAYKVKSLSFWHGAVTGKNCDISVQLLPMVGGGYQIEVSVPINGFDSGDKGYDQDVKTVLKESEQPDILFHSKAMSETEWRALGLKSSTVLEGELSIAGKSYPISVPAELTKTKTGIEIDGVTIVPFSKFDLQPPKIGGGLIAKADNNLELHYHILSEKILGADRVVAPAKEVVSPFPVPTPSPSASPLPPSLKELPLEKRKKYESPPCFTSSW